MFKLIITLFLVVGASQAQEKKYSEEEFREALKKAVDAQVDRLKKSSVSQLTKELLEKERKLEERSEQLDKREEQVRLGEESLSKRIAKLESRQSKILGCLDENARKEAIRIKQLVSVISNMKPAKAAELLSVQDAKISVKIIELIEPERASKIFNLMDKEVSARLQKQYLNMRQ